MADIKLGASALDGFYVGSTAVDKVYVGDVEIFSSAPPFDSGLVLNGVFDDTSNLTLGSSWAVSGGVVTYDAVQDNSQLKLDLTTLTNGNNYDLTFDVIDDGGRMEVKGSGDNFLTAQTISGFTTRNAGTYTISFTANDDHTQIRFRADNGSGGAFSLDNMSLFDVTAEDSIEQANPVGYFKPESIVTSGSNVTQWTDTINGYNFSTATGQPTLVNNGGVDMVSFNGSSNMETSDTSHFDFNPTVDEFSIVAKITGAASSNNNMISRNSTSAGNNSGYQYSFALRDSRTLFAAGGSGKTSFNSPTATSTNDLAIMTVSTTLATIRINGNDIDTLVPGSNNYDVLTSLGARNGSNFAGSVFDIERLAFFDKVLSTEEIAAIETEFNVN